MGCDCSESFPFDFEPNGNPFGSKSKGNCRYDHIPFNVEGNGNIVSGSSDSLFEAKRCGRNQLVMEEVRTSWKETRNQINK